MPLQVPVDHGHGLAVSSPLPHQQRLGDISLQEGKAMQGAVLKPNHYTVQPNIVQKWPARVPVFFKLRLPQYLLTPRLSRYVRAVLNLEAAWAFLRIPRSKIRTQGDGDHKMLLLGVGCPQCFIQNRWT